MRPLAKEHSFDVVSQVDLQEVDNTVNQVNKEISQRYDFKGSTAAVDWDGKSQIKIEADDDFKLQAVVEILKGKAVRRGIAVRSLEFGKVEKASGDAVRQVVTVIQGIAKEKGKEIVAAVKDLKLKVQAQVMDEQVRVSAKSIDELQAVIQSLKQRDFGVELQFTNFRAH